MATPITTPEVGQTVWLRNRLARVRAIDPYEPPNEPSLHLVEVEYLDNRQYPATDQVLWEIETTARVLEPATRQTVEVDRVVRDTLVAREVKQLHGFRCQVCGLALVTPDGPYAEAAHIRPLGSPHGGPDVVSNVLCLCPNHHVLFDSGAFSVAADFSLLGPPSAVGSHTTLRITPKHDIDPEHLAYHQTAIYRPS